METKADRHGELVLVSPREAFQARFSGELNASTDFPASAWRPDGYRPQILR
jgi:hypothetical protein